MKKIKNKLPLPSLKTVVKLTALSVLTSMASAASVELIPNRNYDRGFYIQFPQQSTLQGIIRWDQSKTSIPLWKIAQWEIATNASLFDSPVTSLSGGARRWGNIYQTFTAGPWGSAHGRTQCQVNAFPHYQNKFRDGSEKDWPAQLVSGRIADPSNFNGQPGHLAGNAPYLDEMEHLIFKYRGELTYEDNFHGTDSTGASYDKLKHNAHYTVFFTLQYLRQQGQPDSNEYIFFGVGIYHDGFNANTFVRTRHVLHDNDTQKMIYGTDFNMVDYTTNQNRVFTVGNEEYIEGHLHGRAIDAIAIASGENRTEEMADLAIYLEDGDPSNFTIGGMNYGWETSGLSNCAIKCRDISLRAYLK